MQHTPKTLLKGVRKEAKMGIHVMLDIVELFFREAKVALQKGDVVKIREFGSFKVVQRKARTCRDIYRNKTITIPARWQVKFKQSKKLKKVLNSGK